MMDRRSLTAGVVLLMLGVFFLIRRAVPFSGPGAILLLIGTIFLVLAAVRRWRGPLLPAGVLLGLGTGFLLQEPLSSAFPRWATLLLGLGSGFLLVAAIDRAAGHERRPPPLVPGIILVSIALIAGLAWRVEWPIEQIAVLWPWAFVVAGVVLLLTALRRKA
jgi:hypothetical protein